MGPYRRPQKRKRAAPAVKQSEAERKAADETQAILAKARRATSRKAQTRRSLMRDMVIALVVAITFGVFWKQLIILLTGVVVP
jgi:hypothetical protein